MSTAVYCARPVRTHWLSARVIAVQPAAQFFFVRTAALALFKQMSSSCSTSRVPLGSSTASGEVRPSNSLHFKRLPPGADNTYILSFISLDTIAHKDGQPMITIFPLKEGYVFKHAKITFADVETAKSLLAQWNNVCPPYSKTKLIVNYWEERKKSERPPAPAQAHFSTINDIRQKKIEKRRQKDEDYYVQLRFGDSDYQTPCRPSHSTIDKLNQKVPIQQPKPNNSIIIHGLPENISLDGICTFVGGNVAMGPSDKPFVQILHPKNGYRSARVVMKTIAEASRVIKHHDGKPLPGYTHNLTINYNAEKNDWLKENNISSADYEKVKQKVLADLEREQVIKKKAIQRSKPESKAEATSDKPKTVVRNVVYIEGISRKYFNNHLIEAVESKTGRKVSSARVFRHPDGNSKGCGTISYKDAADAEHCIENLNGRKLEDSGATVAVRLFESTRIKRLEEAIGNEHLFDGNAKGYAYDCLGCLETWGEKDMIGCVSLDRQADPEIHFLCQDCVRRYCESNKLDGRLGDYGTGFPCGQDNCKRVFLWAQLNRVLTNRETAARLDKRMTDEALQKIEGIEFCKEDCGFGAFLPDRRMMPFFSCQNPECMVQFCRNCQVSFMEHADRTCDEVDPRRRQEKENQRLKEEINEKLSLSQMLVCPQCSLRVGKDGGCNFMTCRCGCTMCYVCKQANITYTHFSEGTCNQNETTDDVDRRNYDRTLVDINTDPEMKELWSAFSLS